MVQTIMLHPIHRVESFDRVGSHTLRISFTDGLSREINFAPVLKGELLGPLQDPDVFAQVQLDAEVHTLVWPSGADFDPAILHDWPAHEADFKAAAQRWSEETAVA